MRTLLDTFRRITDCFKTKSEVCIKAVEADPSFLRLVPDHFKTQEMCERAVEDDPSSLQYVPDIFATQEQIDLWYDDRGYCNDDEDNFFKWYNDYKKSKAPKA